LPQDIATSRAADEEVIVVQMLDKRAFHYFVEDIELKLPVPDLNISLARSDDGWDVTVSAKSFLKDLCLMADRLDPAAVVDSMLVTLLPGESHVFRVTTDKSLSAEDIVVGTVLRTANDLVNKN
jgi:beta-mannosidase